MQTSQRSATPLSVVLLASTAGAVPPEPPWPQERVEANVSVWCGLLVASESRPEWVAADDLRQVLVRPAKKPTDRLRRPIARIRSDALARRGSMSPDYLWALKSDRLLSRAIRSSDILLSLDTETDRALRVSPELARGVLVLDSAHATAQGATWVALREWCGVIDAVGRQELPGDVDTPSPPPLPLLEPLLRHLELTGMRCAEGLQHPQARTVLAALSVLQERLGQPDLLEAVGTYVDLWEGLPSPGDAELGAITTRAARRADEALDLGDRPLAMHRLQSAAAVAWHRARHAETPSSPLVEHPTELLAPIWESRAYRCLRDDTVPRPALTSRKRPPSSTAGPFIPRVTILPGAYGTFHHDLVAALSGPARVRVSTLLDHPSLRRRRLTASDLQLLDALRRGEIDVMGQRWDSAPADLDPTAELVALKSLAQEIRGADVVLGEWFDAATMWATHLVPQGSRMVVRAHGLDVLDPWLHLVDWRGVDKILATTPALRGLIHDLTGDAGAPEPALVLPYRPDLAGPDPQRDPNARFVIGMIGWRRQVKDPHFALDLLERDPRRRLVLIGANFPKRGPGLTQPYADSFRERLADPDLAARVEIVGRTDDVRVHLARVGIILSASRREGWHLGLIEGAASGAVPVVRNWPLLASREGARTTHPPEWVVEDLDEADRRISDLADSRLWAAASQRARSMTLQRYAPGPIAEAYRALVLGS